MSPSLLVVISGSILGLLGCAHLVLTYRGPKLLPRDRTLVARMQEAELVITRQTTLWRAWIGFNGSHSLGAMLFGFVYCYLALAHPAVLFGSPPLLLCGLATLLAYAALALRYWFVTPRVGIGISLACYVGALVLGWR